MCLYRCFFLRSDSVFCLSRSSCVCPFITSPPQEDDGCGGKVKCGTNNGACPTNQNCTITGQCITPPQPYTCTATKTRCDPAMYCGTQTNNCGKHMVCGMCPPNYRCSVTYASGGVPLSSECVPAQPPLQPCPNKCDYGQVCGFQFNEVCGINIPCGPPCPNGFRCADDGASCVKTRVCPPRPTCLGNWTCSAQVCKRGKGIVDCLGAIYWGFTAQSGFISLEKA